jgi:hypothetical protein
MDATNRKIAHKHFRNIMHKHLEKEETTYSKYMSFHIVLAKSREKVTEQWKFKKTAMSVVKLSCLQDHG